MNIILHITQRKKWEQAKLLGIYHSDTLDLEGFIHCSLPNQIVQVANRFFANQSGLVLLVIDSAKVQPEIRYEKAEVNELFPHIYGELNLDAVVKVIDFEPNQEGRFQAPKE